MLKTAPTSPSFKRLGHYYDNLTYQLAKLSDDGNQLKIAPRPLPMKNILAPLIFFVVFVVAGDLLMRHLDPTIPLIRFSWFGIAWVCTGLLTALALMWMQIMASRRAMALGPWLVFDRKTKILSVPQQNAEFRVDEVIRLQELSIKWGSGYVTEIQLITENESGEVPCLVMTSSVGGKWMDSLLQAIHRATSIPVIRVQESFFTDEKFKTTVLE